MLLFQSRFFRFLWGVPFILLFVSGCGHRSENAEHKRESSLTADKPKAAVHRIKPTSESPAIVQKSRLPPSERDDDLLSGTQPLTLVKGRVTLPEGALASSATVELVHITEDTILGRVAGIAAIGQTSPDGKYRLCAPAISSIG